MLARADHIAQANRSEARMRSPSARLTAISKASSRSSGRPPMMPPVRMFGAVIDLVSPATASVRVRRPHDDAAWPRCRPPSCLSVPRHGGWPRHRWWRERWGGGSCPPELQRLDQADVAGPPDDEVDGG